MPALPLDTLSLAFGAGLIAAVNPCGFGGKAARASVGSRRPASTQTPAATMSRPPGSTGIRYPWPGR